jgi:hypothetical protein
LPEAEKYAIKEKYAICHLKSIYKSFTHLQNICEILQYCSLQLVCGFPTVLVVDRLNSWETRSRVLAAGNSYK